MYQLPSEVIDDSDKLVYCRTCAQKKKDLIPIFSDEGKDRKLAEKINNCLPVFVVEGDWLPLQVCLRCVLWLETAQQLRTSCLSADHKLRQVFTEPPDYEPLDTSFIDFDDYGEPSDTVSDVKPVIVQPQTDPLGISKDTELSGALQFLSAELGVKDPRSMLIVQKTPSKSDDIPLKMLVQKDVIPPPLHCDQCHKTMKSSRYYRHHCRNAHKREMYPCNICFVFFSKYYLLRDHIELIHPNVNVPSGSYVNLKVPGTDELRKKKLNLVRVYKERKCSKCKETFPYEALGEFRKHMKVHRDALRKEVMKTASIKCDYCTLMFLTDRSKIFHMKTTHREYKPYECEFCNKQFHIKKCFDDHRLTHGEARPFLCSVCGKAFAAKSMLTSHMYQHRLWTCMICNMTIGKIRKEQHLVSHIDKRIYQCMECGQSFFDRESLREHTQSHFVTVFQCDICGFCFSSQVSLSIHQGYHKDELTQRYKCPVKLCFRQFATVADAAKHVSLHPKEDQFTIVRVREQKNKCRVLYCNECASSFRHMGMYLDHMSAHQTDPNAPVWLYCALCKVRVRDEAALTSHLESHPQAFDFPCRHCKENFVTDKQREDHEGITHGRKVQCPQCLLVIRNKLVLQSHINSVHTGERPFVCNICNKAFFCPRVLKKHKSVHTGIKSFACNLCNKSFRLKQDLAKHYLLHTNEKMYKCSECSYSSNRRKDINLHIAAEHADICDEDSD